MTFRHIWIFPVIAVGLLLIGIFSGYIIAVVSEHYPAVLPLISDGGVYKPEAPIFGQLLNMAALFYVLTLYLRHLHIVTFYGDRLHWERTRWWHASFLLMIEGFFSALGLSMVANFREHEMINVHMVGALLAFFGVVIYGWGQIILSYVLVPRMVSPLITHFRLIIMVLTTTGLIMQLVAGFGNTFLPPTPGPRPDTTDPKKKCDKDSPYFKKFLIAASSEWTMVLAMQLFVLSLVFEFSSVRLIPPHVIVERKIECDEQTAL